MTRGLVVFAALVGLILAAAQFSITFKRSESSRLKKKTGQQTLYDTLDEYYLADITLGTPAQNFSVAIDTLSANLWILDVNCETQFCHGYAHDGTLKNSFNGTASSTFLDSHRTFQIPYKGGVSGLLGKDTLNMAGFSIPGQDFGRATDVPLQYTKEPVDGVLGLGFPTGAFSQTKPVIASLLPQLESPMFSIWLEKKGEEYGDAGGSILYGGLDKTACDQEVNYVPLATTKVWGYYVDGVSFADYIRVRKEQALSTTGSGWTGIPSVVLTALVKTIKAQYDLDHQAWLIPCSSVKTFPDITLTIAGRPYTIKSENYVIDLGLHDGQCALAFYYTDAEETQWVIGDALIRGYCHIYDFALGRIGFAKFIKDL